MTRKVSASGNNKQPTSMIPAAPQPWREHLETIKAFHRMSPYPKQQRHVVIPLAAGSSRADEVTVTSRRNQIQAMRLSGSATTEPVMEMVRTVPIQHPSREAVNLLSELALLTAEYFELMAAKRKLSD